MDTENLLLIRPNNHFILPHRLLQKGLPVGIKWLHLSTVQLFRQAHSWVFEQIAQYVFCCTTVHS
jgi:hypothetical protein